MRRWNRRKIVISVVVVLVLAVGGYFGYARLLGGQGSATDLTQFGIEASQEVQVIAVRRGNLSNAVSVNGSLRYATRETFKIPFDGKVQDVEVEAGDRVKKGDVLLVMDEAGLVEATKSYREAEVNLQKAQKALDEMIEPPETTVRAASIKLDNALNALDNARDDLENALDPAGTAQKAAQKTVRDAETAVEDAAEGIANAESAISDAQDAVADAETAIEDAQDGVADAETGLVNSHLSLRAAEKALADHDKEITDDDLDKAREAVTRARRDLELAISSSETAKVNANASVRAALKARKDAYDEYNAVWIRWLGIDLADVADHGTLEPTELMAALEIHLESLYGRVAKEIATDVDITQVDRPLTEDYPDTIYDEQLISIWLRFNAPSVVVDCGYLPATAARRCILKEFNDAWDKLLPLEEALNAAETEAEKSFENADRSIVDAQRAIDTAQKALTDLFPDADRAEARQDLVTRIDLAQDAVLKAERQIEKSQDGVAQARRQLEKAQQTVEDRRADLEKAQNTRQTKLDDLQDAREELARVEDPNNRENTALRLDINAKQLDVDNARKELSDLQSPTLADIELARAELTAAQRTFDDAQIPEGEREIVATFDGIVGEVHVKKGDGVNNGTDAIVIADPRSVEMRGSVDEVDVLFLQVGDQAEVSMDALGDQPTVGTITEIAAFGTTTSGTVFGANFEQDVGSVSYPVTIGIQAPPGTSLPEGLSARAQVVIRDLQNVLLVPVGAIFGTQQNPQLLVQTGTNPATYEFRPVVLGVSDDFWTEVISGVNEGDDILMTVIGGSGETEIIF